MRTQASGDFASGTRLGYDEAMDSLVFLAMLILALALLLVCVLGPLFVGTHVSPWLGALTALASAWVWRRIGPPPSPGLLSGQLCITGFAGILVVFALLFWEAVTGLFR